MAWCSSWCVGCSTPRSTDILRSPSSSNVSNTQKGFAKPAFRFFRQSTTGSPSAQNTEITNIFKLDIWGQTLVPLFGYFLEIFNYFGHFLIIKFCWICFGYFWEVLDILLVIFWKFGYLGGRGIFIFVCILKIFCVFLFVIFWIFFSCVFACCRVSFN